MAAASRSRARNRLPSCDQPRFKDRSSGRVRNPVPAKRFFPGCRSCRPVVKALLRRVGTRGLIGMEA
jgi:hypothetical protein